MLTTDYHSLYSGTHPALIIETRDHTRSIISHVKWLEILDFIQENSQYRKSFAPEKLPRDKEFPIELSSKTAIRLSQIMTTKEFLETRSPEQVSQINTLAKFLLHSDGIHIQVNETILSMPGDPVFFSHRAAEVFSRSPRIIPYRM